MGFRKSLESSPTFRPDDRWGDRMALEDTVMRGATRFRDPGRGQGLAGVRIFSADPETSERFLAETLMFTRSDEGFEAQGPTRRSFVAYDELASRGRGGA